MEKTNEIKELLEIVLCNQVAIQERLISIENNLGRNSTVGNYDHQAIREFNRMNQRHDGDILDELHRAQ
jgi:hypothetical protein